MYRKRNFLVLFRPDNAEVAAFLIDTLATDNWAVARGHAWRKRAAYASQYGAGSILLVREVGEQWKTIRPGEAT